MMVGMPRSRMRLIVSFGFRAVADQIAEVIDGIGGHSIDRREDRFGGGAVAVQIGEDGDAGGHADARRAKGSDFREMTRGIDILARRVYVY